MNNLLQSLKGRKTYIVAGLIVAYGIIGIIIGQLTPEQAIQLVLNGLGLGAVRSAIANP